MNSYKATAEHTDENERLLTPPFKRTESTVREVSRKRGGRTMRRSTNRKRRTPLPGLAEHIAAFTGAKAKKRAYSAFLANVASRIYELSIPTTRQRL
jgi:hypothetical protein